MLHIPGLSHRQHRKGTQDARQSSAAAAASSAAGLASTSTIQRPPIGGGTRPVGHGPDLYDSQAANDPYAGQHVVAETHHLRYLPIKKRHGLFRKPTHHMYEFDTHYHGLHSAMAPHSTSTAPGAAHALTPTATTTPVTATTTTPSTTTLNRQPAPTISQPQTPPTPRRYGTDISTTRMRTAPISITAPAAAGPSSPLATATSASDTTTATGIERTQIATVPTTGTEGNEDRELLIKTTTRATPAIVDPVIVPVSARAETVTPVTTATPMGEGEHYARQEGASEAYFDASREERRDEYYERQVQGGDAASVSTNDMYARAFDEQSAGAAGAHPPVMPAGEWVETHYRTESGRFEEVVRRE